VRKENLRTLFFFRNTRSGGYLFQLCIVFQSEFAVESQLTCQDIVARERLSTTMSVIEIVIRQLIYHFCIQFIGSCANKGYRVVFALFRTASHRKLTFNLVVNMTIQQTVV